MVSSRITRSLAAFVIGAGALLTMAGSPAAADIVDTDQVLLNGPNADFGANTSVHSWGQPDIGGFVSWGDNTDNNNWVSVFGKVWVDNFSGSGCARIKATFRNPT